MKELCEVLNFCAFLMIRHGKVVSLLDPSFSATIFVPTPATPALIGIMLVTSPWAPELDRGPFTIQCFI